MVHVDNIKCTPTRRKNYADKTFNENLSATNYELPETRVWLKKKKINRKDINKNKKIYVETQVDIYSYVRENRVVPPSRLSEVLAVSPAIFIGIKRAECLQRERTPVDTDEVRVSEPEGALVYLSPTNLLAGVLYRSSKLALAFFCPT